ncbi:MAG: hypothetical protein RLZZ227_2220 [Pseudomonadota bacterium]
MQPAIRGYTLLELLVVLALVAVFASMAIPGWGRTLQARTGEIVIHELARTMNFARAAAVTNGSIVTLCRSGDGLACNGNWEDGLLLFTDANADRIRNGADRLLRHTGRIQGSLRLRSFPNRQYLQFTALGFTYRQNGNFTWCPPGNDVALAQQLIFSQSGRSRFARDSNGDGQLEGADGAPLVCEG